MSVVRYQFVAAAAFSSRLIEYFGAGGFSHVDAVLPDGRLLGARSDICGGQKYPGVWIRPQDYEKWPRRVVMELSCTDEQAKAWELFLRAQIGKPYDKMAIFGFLVGRAWREDDSWFCSELGTRALEVAKICPDPLTLTPNKVTPGTLACIVSALGGKISEAEAVTDLRRYTNRPGMKA